MKCMNINCEEREFCEKVYKLNGYKLGEDDRIMIPNQFYFELNIGNRFVKRGVPKEGFKFGCMSLKENQNDDYVFYIDNNPITDFTFGDLIDSCNSAFSEMIANGDIKIG